MTTVAFDGRWLASDSQLNDGQRRVHEPRRPKFYARKCFVVAWSGAVSWHEQLADWLASPRKLRGDYPIEPELDSEAMVYTGGQWRRYTNSAHGFELVRGKWAIGSGSDYALAGMLLGHDAVEAVWVGAQLDLCTSAPIFAIDMQAYNGKTLGVVKEYGEERPKAEKGRW